MWQETKDFVIVLYQRITDDDIFGLGAQLAYFLLLSLFPFLLFLMTLVGYLPLDAQNVTDFIERYAPGEISGLINENVSELVNNQSGSLLSIGVIGTLWAASNAINAIMRGFNRAYEVEEDRSFIVTRLIAIILTIAMVLVICMAFLLPVFGRMIGEYIFAFFGLSEGFVSVWQTLRWVVSSAVIFIVLLALYRMAPNMRIYFRNVVWGALFGTIGWQLASLAFSFYVNSIGNYSATYGSLGTVIVLMIWFYLTGIIIMIGGVINAILRKKMISD
ncbi:YihY/virulence factor BrkB family protein [Lentibacillus sp. CBA3610]|uniref:YihY/virulence factor BrkB family protein n=1 Tax=Lentibacillus sp. CBA3610 TaxID=2518176 RepID=UPI001594F492|nr:YihY/virulence factor BrkB family protein [Lentibacillus sp. CBA3610]QKY71537.1 YihY/virulence factor BrkB family protein [Lentibacillus sp. CBA3610]